MTILENQLPVSGPVALNQLGLPAYCGTVWIDFFKGNLAISTREKHAHAVTALYRHASTMRPQIDVDFALTEPDLVAIDTLLSSFLLSRQNIDNDRFWPLVSDFVFGFLREITGSEAVSLQRKLQFMATRYGQLRPRSRMKQQHIRCVPYEVLEDLFSLVHPQSTKNPFRTDQNRWRNYMLFMLLLQLGLRKSELLILNVGSFRSQYDVEVGENRFWLDIAVTHSDVTPVSHPGITRVRG